MRYTETKRVTMLSCDRCDARIDDIVGDKTDWFVANAALMQSPLATVEYHLCPMCRVDLGDFMAVNPNDPRCDICGELEEGSLLEWNGETGNHVECEQGTRAPVTDDKAERILDVLVDILYPLDEYKDSPWNGGDVCEAVARLVGEYRPEAKDRQQEAPEGCASCSEGDHASLEDGVCTCCGSVVDADANEAWLRHGWAAYKAAREQRGI